MNKNKKINQWSSFPYIHPELIKLALEPLAHKLIRNYQTISSFPTIPGNLIFGAQHHLLQRRYFFTNLAFSVGIILCGFLCYVNFSLGVFTFAIPIVTAGFLVFQFRNPWCRKQPLSRYPGCDLLIGVEFRTRHALFYDFAEYCEIIDILFFDYSKGIFNISEAGKVILSLGKNYDCLLDTFEVFFQQHIMSRCKELATLVVSTAVDKEISDYHRVRLKSMVEKALKHGFITLKGLGFKSVDDIFIEAYKVTKK